MPEILNHQQWPGGTLELGSLFCFMTYIHTINVVYIESTDPHTQLRWSLTVTGAHVYVPSVPVCVGMCVYGWKLKSGMKGK